MKKVLFFSMFFLFSFFTHLTAQTFWAEAQYQVKDTHGDSIARKYYFLQGFYLSKINKAGFSCNFYTGITNQYGGWGEVAILPAWTKETKLGLFSLSLGAGFETATPKPRFTGSVFYLKEPFEFLFLWEQGSNHLKNNWHLSYITYKVIEHEDGTYCSLGLWSQRDVSHGVRFTIGTEEQFEVWGVIGKPNFKEKNIGIIAGFKFFLK